MARSFAGLIAGEGERRRKVEEKVKGSIGFDLPGGVIAPICHSDREEAFSAVRLKDEVGRRGQKSDRLRTEGAIPKSAADSICGANASIGALTQEAETSVDRDIVPTGNVEGIVWVAVFSAA